MIEPESQKDKKTEKYIITPATLTIYSNDGEKIGGPYHLSAAELTDLLAATEPEETKQ
jgi:hypothetical protein